MVFPFLSLAIVLAQSMDCRHLGPQDAPVAQANDNRVPAGTLEGGVLTLRLVAQPATWHPEGEEGCGVPLFAFAEEGPTAKVAAELDLHSVGTAGFKCNGPHAGAVVL